MAAATEATALAEATAATEAAAVAKTEADIKAMEAIEKTKITQAAELDLDIEEDGQTATGSELVDPKNEDLGEQDVVYNWDSIKLTWEKQDELTPTDTSDRTQIAGRSDEVLVKSKDDQDAPSPTKPKRGKVGSDRTIVSPTGRREDVSDVALTDKEKETNKKYPADLVLARNPYSLAGSLEKVPAESSEDYQKRLDNYLDNRLKGETEPEFNKRTGLKDIVSTSAKTGKPRKAQMLTDKLGDVQYAGEKKVRALSQIPPGTKIHWDGKDWIVDKHEITDQDRRTPGTIDIGLIQRGGARFSYKGEAGATSNKEGMVKLGDTEVMQVTSNLVDADTMGTNLYGLTSENTSSTIKDKPLDKTPATLGWQLTEKEANADKKLKKNKTAKQLEKEEARRSGEEIEETVAETWEEMSSSKVPFDKLSAENQLRLEEAREDLGITAELVDEIDQEVAPTQESRDDTEGTGQTAETVTTELVEEFGNNVNKTIEKGKLVIVDDVSQLPANIKMSSTANGAFDKKSGISYLVANRIQKGQARRILLHEIGEHYGLEKMVGKDYMSLLNRLKTLRKQNADVDAIFAQVQEQYPELKVNSKPFLQEVMAKVGESAPNNTLFRRMVGAVKNFLRRLGLYDVNKFKLSDTDIQDMILNSLRVSLAETTGTVTREQASGTPAVQMSKGS